MSAPPEPAALPSAVTTELLLVSSIVGKFTGLPLEDLPPYVSEASPQLARRLDVNPHGDLVNRAHQLPDPLVRQSPGRDQTDFEAIGKRREQMCLPDLAPSSSIEAWRNWGHPEEPYHDASISKVRYREARMVQRRCFEMSSGDRALRVPRVHPFLVLSFASLSVG